MPLSLAVTMRLTRIGRDARFAQSIRQGQGISPRCGLVFGVSGHLKASPQAYLPLQESGNWPVQGMSDPIFCETWPANLQYAVQRPGLGKHTRLLHRAGHIGRRDPAACPTNKDQVTLGTVPRLFPHLLHVAALPPSDAKGWQLVEQHEERTRTEQTQRAARDQAVKDRRQCCERLSRGQRSRSAPGRGRPGTNSGGLRLWIHAR